jgi:hypothetical protein
MKITYNTPKNSVSGYAVLSGKIDQRHYAGTIAVIAGNEIPIEVRLFKIGSKWHACAFHHDSKKGIHAYGYAKGDYDGRACFEALQGLGFNFPRLTNCQDVQTFGGLLEDCLPVVGYDGALVRYFTL